MSRTFNDNLSAITEIFVLHTTWLFSFSWGLNSFNTTKWDSGWPPTITCNMIGSLSSSHAKRFLIPQPHAYKRTFHRSIYWAVLVRNHLFIYYCWAWQLVDLCVSIRMCCRVMILIAPKTYTITMVIADTASCYF